ncbi:hypothetical protein QQF64_001876 [Cirrhinus molitorella]|uniref:Uncharacterized protein n=1 Tax=Cirrhinus molitorella TaxID=172907 RepID=A0ABR3MNJ2_9TELE
MTPFGHLYIGNECWKQLEKAHKSTIRRLANGCRHGLMDRLSCETQGVGGERRDSGRRCQRELERGHERIITVMISGRKRRRPMDITVCK